MIPTRLVFVSTVGEAPSPRDDTRVVVIDTAWTPGPDARADVEPVRPIVSGVLREVDLFHAALDALDGWAAISGVADGLAADDVAWWFRLRPFLVDYLHERMLWSHVVARLGDRDLVEIHVPGAEGPLVDVLRCRTAAGGPALFVTEAPGAADPVASASTLPAERLFDRILWRRRRSERRARRTRQVHDAVLADRVARIAGSGGPVLAITQPRIHQVVQTASGARRVDPQLAPIIERLEDMGVPVVTVGLEVDHRDGSHWDIIDVDPALLPESLLATRWNRAEDRDLPATAIERTLQAARAVPCVVEGTNLAPSLARELERYCGRWLRTQRHTVRRVVRMVEEIRPVGLLMNHEGIRTPWLAAARWAGVPVFAVQHGLIYPRHAVYSHPRHAGLPYPDVTFTFGDYERRVLLECGGYRPDEVVVAGSPRSSQLTADDPAVRGRARSAVRGRLGIDEAATVLVVSTAHTAIFRRFHLTHMIAELLAEPLPNVHIVFKLHPGEDDEGPYRRLVEGLARRAGHRPPPMTPIREIDLYELLMAADAHLGLHSTVLTDAVVAGTPNLLSVAEAYRDLLGYVEAGVATPVASAAALRRALGDPPHPAPAARQSFLADHFAPGEAAATIATRIRDVVADRASPPANVET